CRTATSRAKAYASYDEVDRLNLKLSKDGKNALGRELDRHETYAAILRVRCLAGIDPVETTAQWRAVDAHPEGARRLRMKPETWTALGEQLQATADALVARYITGQPDAYRPGPGTVEYT